MIKNNNIKPMKTISNIRIKNLIIYLFFGAFFGFSQNQDPNPEDRISVLNFGVFHFGETSDAQSMEFDEHNEENIKQAHEIAKKIAAFKPTIILVEREPKNNKKLIEMYQSYLKNPNIRYKKPTELELIAFEVGRLCGVEKIFGIDHKMDYNFSIGYQIQNTIDKRIHDFYDKNPLIFHPEININLDKLSLFDKLKIYNHSKYLDYSIEFNADILTHAGTENNFEGADEAAKFYQRNLRMYSEMNRLNIKATDRVFLILGATHTAFFRDFLSRSPKYKMVDTFEYLKKY
jgi:hypothetical protein